MGASNALKAYQLWRARLPHQPFSVLAYMALRARDNDAAPWYGAGHDELAAIALGLLMRTDRDKENGRRQVRRAMTVLQRAGAVTTHRHGHPGLQAVYLLWLNAPSPVAQRPVNNSQNIGRSPSGDESQNIGHSATGVPPNIGRSAPEHRSLSDRPRRKEEEELQERRSSKATVDNGETRKTPHLRPVQDPWEEDEQRARRNGQTSP